MPPNVADLIAERAAAHPEHPALMERGVATSYGTLLAHADAVAARLRAILAKEWPGVAAARIALFCPDGADYVALALGILRAGGCLVPVAPELALPERAAQVALTAPHIVIAAGPHPWLPGAAAGEESAGAVWQWTRGPGAGTFPEERFAALAPAFVRFSSGTTGESKGVVLGHETLLARIRSANRRLRITESDRVLWTLPMAHHFAVSIVLYLLSGATTVIEGSHLAADILTTARACDATVIYGSPFHHALLAAEDSGRAWPALRLAVSTAASLSAETAAAFRERYGAPLAQGLGIIEAGLPLLNDDPRKPLSVGRPDDFAVRLRGGSEIGELLLRGPGIFDAYLAPWRERAEVLEDGWFATGDLASQDADGQVFLRGRAKSVINVGGMKFFPEEIEAVLDAHPAVLASRVRGEPHARWEMIAVAEVIARDPLQPPGAAALARHCRERLAGYKVPLRFACVESLPRTANGKLRR